MKKNLRSEARTGLGFIKQVWSSRKAGHTAAALLGANNMPNGCVYVVPQHSQIGPLKSKFPNVDFVTIGDANSLRGIHTPVLVDHFLIEGIACDAMSCINELEQRLEEYEKEPKK